MKCGPGSGASRFREGLGRAVQAVGARRRGPPIARPIARAVAMRGVRTHRDFRRRRACLRGASAVALRRQRPGRGDRTRVFGGFRRTCPQSSGTDVFRPQAHLHGFRRHDPHGFRRRPRADRLAGQTHRAPRPRCALGHQHRPRPRQPDGKHRPRADEGDARLCRDRGARDPSARRRALPIGRAVEQPVPARPCRRVQRAFAGDRCVDAFVGGPFRRDLLRRHLVAALRHRPQQRPDGRHPSGARRVLGAGAGARRRAQRRLRAPEPPRLQQGHRAPGDPAARRPLAGPDLGGGRPSQRPADARAIGRPMDGDARERPAPGEGAGVRPRWVHGLQARRRRRAGGA